MAEVNEKKKFKPHIGIYILNLMLISYVWHSKDSFVIYDWLYTILNVFARL